MNYKKLNVLLIVEQCNPETPSVPLEGYQYFNSISQFANVTLVTHERNKQALEKVQGTPDFKSGACLDFVKTDQEIIYVSESPRISKYFTLVDRLTNGKKGVNWPLQHALSYFIYEEFNNKVYHCFKEQVLRGDYDIVHALTPMMPRYPVKMIKACKNTPFMLGPVNGGVPFPKGFEQVAKKEFAHFNFLRNFCRFLPNYTRTYEQADKVLAGSTYTFNMLKENLNIAPERLDLFYENGIPGDFFNEPTVIKDDPRVNLLFVGRLVPYKGADTVIKAISQLSQTVKEKIWLTVVGDGAEKENLHKLAQDLDVSNIISFTGWVNHSETLKFYRKADVFCFPSIREFGGAVVLEAMACGLPCIVVNNGGIGEYVTEETGFKMEPVSSEYLIQKLANHIQLLVENEDLRKSMSAKAKQRAKEFSWEQKATKIIQLYEELLKNKIESPSYSSINCQSLLELPQES